MNFGHPATAPRIRRRLKLLGKPPKARTVKSKSLGAASRRSAHRPLCRRASRRVSRPAHLSAKKLSSFATNWPACKIPSPNRTTSLQRLRTDLVQNSQQYHGTIAAVNARLQVGTTPGNPILVQQFKSAQADLDRIANEINKMNNLVAAVANNSTLSAYMAEAARAAFSVSGAVDEDHRQLAILEDEVNRTAVLIDRLLKELGSRRTPSDQLCDDGARQPQSDLGRHQVG